MKNQFEDLDKKFQNQNEFAVDNEKVEQTTEDIKEETTDQIIDIEESDIENVYEIENENTAGSDKDNKQKNSKKGLSLHYKVFSICAIVLFSFHLYFGGDKTMMPMLFFVMSAVEAYTKYRESSKKVYKFFSISSIIIAWSFFLLHIIYFTFRFAFKFFGDMATDKASGFFYNIFYNIYTYFFG